MDEASLLQQEMYFTALKFSFEAVMIRAGVGYKGMLGQVCTAFSTQEANIIKKPEINLLNLWFWSFFLSLFHIP